MMGQQTTKAKHGQCTTLYGYGGYADASLLGGAVEGTQTGAKRLSWGLTFITEKCHPVLRLASFYAQKPH
jgi:hypothetical protein